MTHPTNDRIDHRIVFALAQVPYSHPNGQLIASLAPLMDLETGETFSSQQSAFPADGYVFWGSARSDLEPGDLVVGTLRKASGDFYGSSDQSWYQVGMEASSPHGEIFEYVRTTLPDEAGLRRLVDGRKMIDTSHSPPKLFFAWVNDRLVGPFHPQRYDHFRSATGYCCEPTDRAGSIVRVAQGRQLEEYVKSEIGYCEVHLSSTTQHPAKSSNGKFTRRYRLIRDVDLTSCSESTEERMLPTDEFAITKACSLIEGRDKKREAKKIVKSLVEILHDEDRQIESGVVEAVNEIAHRVKLAEDAADEIAASLATTESVAPKIEAAIAQRVEDAIRKRAEEIEADAKQRSETTLAELTELEAEVAKLETAREEKRAELQEYSNQIEYEKTRLSEVIEAATQRLTEGRNQLLGDISLLAPIFGASSIASPNGRPYPTSDASSRSSSNGTESMPASMLVEPPQIVNDPLTESKFLTDRLIPAFGLHGITIADNKIMDLHALLVASRMIALPDVSWVVAYCDAMGGTAITDCVTPEPDWMSFRKCYQGDFGEAIERAVADPSRLHFVVLDGVDRCASHAWLQPMFQVIAGWRTHLPEPSGRHWPHNMRMVFVKEESTCCFPLPQSFARWIIPFETGEFSGSSESETLADGHFPLKAWLMADRVVNGDFALDGLAKAVQSNGSPLSDPMLRSLISRLRDVYQRMGHDEDRIEGPIHWLLRPIELTEQDEE